jgi:pyruvate dehydrogenase E1 component
MMRWNALAMVVRANQAYGELGGHIASYASGGRSVRGGLQPLLPIASARAAMPGHSTWWRPGVFPAALGARRVRARGFVLEGRLTEQDLPRTTGRRSPERRTRPARRAVELPAPLADARLLAVPHRLDGHRPDQLDLPGALHALPDSTAAAGHQGAHVWGVFGDGEMDEPESMSALTLAAREGLDNLVWVVNCNLQRLDGPVRGNGRIIDELEALFAAPAGT